MCVCVCVCVCARAHRFSCVFGSVCALTHLQTLPMFLIKTNPLRPVLIAKFIEICAIWLVNKNSPKYLPVVIGLDLISLNLHCDRKIRIFFEKGQ